MAFSTDSRDSTEHRNTDRPGPDDQDARDDQDEPDRPDSSDPDAVTKLDTTDDTDVREDEAGYEAADRDEEAAVREEEAEDRDEDAAVREEEAARAQERSPDDLAQETAYDDSSLPPDDRPERDEPAPVPTAFGAATVGGAVAASAMAGERRDGDRPDDWRDTDQPAGPAAVGVAEVPSADRAEPTYAEERAETPEAGEEPERGELLPGAAPAAPAPTLWEDDTAQEFRGRWREVQFQFVDDPEGATGAAQALVGEAVEALTAALVEQRTDLDGWRSDQAGDTEQLRVVIRRYRDFLDRLLAL